MRFWLSSGVCLILLTAGLPAHAETQKPQTPRKAQAAPQKTQKTEKPQAKPVDDRAIPILSWESYHKESPYIFLDELWEVRLNDNWSAEEKWHYRIKIQKESAKDMGEQKIYYNKSREEIVDIQAHVETPDGQIYPYTEIQDLAVYEGAPMYSDSRVKVITLPQVNVGSIIDVQMKGRVLHGIIPNQFSEEEVYPSDPHKHYKARYIFPKDKNIAFKQFHAVAAPRKEEKDNTVIYTFEYNETVALEETEVFLPPYTDLFGLSTFSSMTDWSTMADWYRQLVNKNMKDSPEIVQKTKELIAGKTTEREKALAVLEFLQDNLRYVSMSFGDNTVEPHPTDQIFRNSYGDCKDWSLLAKQMLGLAGIKSNISLFSDEFDGNPEWGLPRVSAFDHAILEVTVDGEKYLVDPQLKHYDFQQYPQDYNNAFIFVIEDNGWRFTQIPAAGDNTEAHRIKISASLSPTGGAVYRVKAALGIESSNGLRELWQAVGQDGQDKIFETIETQFAKGGRLSNTALTGIDNRYGAVILDFKVQSPHAYQAVNDMIILQEPFQQYFMNPFVEKERSYPLFVPYNSTVLISGSYKIPQSYKVDYIPANFTLENDLMELSRKMAYKDGKIFFRYGFKTKRGQMPIARYGEMIKLWDQFYQQISKSIILKKE